MQYWSLGFSLFFESQNTFHCVEVDEKKTLLGGQPIFELSEKQLIQLFKDKNFREIYLTLLTILTIK